jgi:NAD(P)H-hydrate repair Nnr-like enzyme with NAD(P)H-hydrate dehydratase domain
VDWHGRVLLAVEEMARRPLLIADAGFMYAAKMSGSAQSYDLFTPDAGELAFLADEEAPHPFYTRGFILQEENRVPDLIARAYEHGNASRLLLVKGHRDMVADSTGILESIDEPSEEAMEAIGGTGDTLTGLAAALAASGMDLAQAASLAARANRLAGAYSRPTPATQILTVIEHIPRALNEVLSITSA